MIYVIDGIKHFKQRYEWDCGLACLKSIIWFINNSSNNEIINTTTTTIEDGELESILNTKSIWSIDLSNVLNFYDIKHRFTTNSPFVNDSHANLTFYQDDWQEDSTRVQNLFNETLKHNRDSLNIISSPRQLPITMIIDHIKLNQPIILLVDSCCLSCHSCHRHNNNNNNFSFSSLTLSTDSHNSSSNDDTIFMGHFIILIGFDESLDQIIYIDPSSKDDRCIMNSKDIDRARLKPGTDMDTIFIYNEIKP